MTPTSTEKKSHILIDKVDSINCSECNTKFDVSQLDSFSKCACPKCEHVQNVSARLGQFLLLDLLGMGGMGAVYYAKDETLGRFVAIKVMLKSVSDDKTFVESFKREAQVVAKLNHPNIAQIYSFGEAKGQLYIVMELVSGRNFEKMVQEDGSLDEALVMKVGLDIACGLQAGDEVGLVHGDIKPENILLDEKDQAKLVDFGIATVAGGSQADGGIWGTPYYISPERVMRKPVDARSDIYSLGATLYHALSGHPPFEGDDPIVVVKARINNAPRPLSALRSDINKKVESVIERMLEPLPAKRYPTYASLISDLRLAVEATRQKKTTHARKVKTKNIVLAKKTTSMMKSTGLSTGNIGNIEGADVTSKRYRLKKIAPTIKQRVVPAVVQPRPKASKPTGRIVLVLFIIVGVVGVLLYSRMQKQQALKAQMNAAALQEQAGKAKQIYDQMEISVSNAVGMMTEARNMAWVISTFVDEILGEKETITPDAVPETVKEQSAPAPVQDSGAPVWLISREELDRRRAKKNKTTVQKEPDVQEQPVETREPEIRKEARRIAVAASKMEPQVNQIKQVLTEALGIRNEIINMSFADVAARKVEKLAGDLNLVQNVEKEIREQVVDIREVKKRLEDQRNAMLDVQKEEERLRQEEKKRLQEERAQAAFLEAERERLIVDTAKVHELLKINEYERAVEFLLEKVASYQTEECKKSINIMQERYSHLVTMKSFIIEMLNVEPFRWGWTQDRYAKDVLGADKNGIKITGGTVSWDNVNARQMLKFADKCMLNPKISAVDMARHNVEAAIFCYEHELLPQSATYARKAISILPRMAAELKRLAPQE